MLFRPNWEKIVPAFRIGGLKKGKCCMATEKKEELMDWGKVAENFESGTRFSKLFAMHCIVMLPDRVQSSSDS
jgi:hypothetical protein